MKILKVFISLFILFAPFVATCAYFDTREKQCVSEWQQKGYSLSESEFICID